MPHFTSDAAQLLVLWLAADEPDACGDSPTGQEEHPYESERESPQKEPVGIDFRESELRYDVADVTMRNRVAA